MSIIGGPDGPTQIFVASSWLSWFGLIIVALLMAPNIIWAMKNRGAENKCKNRLMNILEQIGRYGCMFLMVFNIGIAELGFASAESFIVYLAGNAALLIAYWVFWGVHMKRPSLFSAAALAALPTLIFLLCGATMRHWLLLGFAALFGVAHMYVSIVNARGDGA